MLSVRPVVGRLFTPEDDRRGCGNPRVVISHAFWQREFGGSPDVLLKMLPVDEQSSAGPVAEARRHGKAGTRSIEYY
jgi:hypothetical protein